MSLDQNLFTLNVILDATNPTITDLVDPSGEPHYKKERIGGTPYRMNLYDPHSEALLASATAPEASSKAKTIELYNPPLAVELRSIGTLSFKWSFKWEDHDFEWKRENCFMVRKPDPDVLVAVTKEPPGRLRTSAVQILDYNLNRFDINDRKGLEIVILTALLTFHDLNAAFNAVPPPPYTALPPESSPAPVPPTPPPKPQPKTGMDRIAEIQAARGEINEVTVVDEGSVEDYAAYGAQLLADDAMLFISVRSDAAEQVPKVLAIVEELKRMRHKAGLPDDGLHQYVVYDIKQPKRINLDDPPAGPSAQNYKPPDSLMIHLSKIDMPELKPRPNLDRHATRSGVYLVS
ncbi:hypothetical protein PENSPDRAFT_587366 [Peniophora sp. CONT]|nr:hypothetical protein PENSPDRAFT_587366 [Peniophora sp. CONT]